MGFLFSNPVCAEPPPLAAGAGENKTVDTGVFPITNSPFPAILYANNGGTITAPGALTLNVETSTVGLEATGTGSNITAQSVTLNLTGASGTGASTGASVANGGTISITGGTFNVTSTGLDVSNGGGTINATDVNIVLVGPNARIGAQILTAGSTLILTRGSITDVTGGVGQSIGLRAENDATLIADGTNISGGFNKSAEATSFGHIVLSNLSITQNFVGVQHGALEVSTGGTISADHVAITTSQSDELGAFAQGGAILLKNNSTITTSGELGVGLWSETGSFGPQEGRPSTIEADNTIVTTSGSDAIGAFALFGATINLNGSTVTTTGSAVINTDGATGIYSFLGSTINVTGSSVTAEKASAGQVVDGSVMNITDSTLTGGTNGIRISDDDHTLGPDTVTVSGSTVINQAGNNGEATIRVEGAETNITLNNSTLNSGTGAGVTKHAVLNVTSIDKAGMPFGSVVNLTANSSTLNGDILADATSSANVMLEHKSVLKGAVNENQLTGASGINPTEQITHLPASGLPPQTVNLSIDSTSTWNMRASSTLNTLSVNPQAHINFADPPADPFKTLVMNNLIGTGGIFGMNVDLGLIKGDLIEILAKSEGEHLLTFVNRNQGSDLPVNVALLVVRTPDGGAGFTGEADGGTFKYFVVHGDGSSVTPIKNDWYLVRGDEITPPETTPPPPTNPNPTPAPKPTPPQFAPGDVLPLPPEIPAAPLSRAADLTNTANAAIGTYSSTIPLFYADMQTLVERMGELRLGIETAPAPVPPSPTGVGKGVVESKQTIAPPAPLPRNEWAVWVRGFGNGMRINNDVSRVFDQDVGGFQLGADKRFGSLWSGDVYLGVFGSYFYASRDFRDGGDGSTNAFSLGGYATWIHPQGWYADMVVKYTQMWNYFRTPTLNASISTGDYDIPTVGGSLEVGKRFDFADHCFFIEPQAQLAGVWENGMDYTASNGLRVHGDDQTSLHGRLGARLGMHFDLSEGRAIEPYARAEVIEEFLTGNTVRTNSFNFDSHLSGTVGRFGGGLAAKLSQSVYIYGEYDYATGDHIQQPWSVSAGLRWQW